MCLYCEYVVFDFEFSREKRNPEIFFKKKKKKPIAVIAKNAAIGLLLRCLGRICKRGYRKRSYTL